MKTILSNGTYSRVSNEVADHEVSLKRASYVSKSEWKKNVRDVKTEQQVEENEKKKETVSKKAIKHSKIKEKQRK